MPSVQIRLGNIFDGNSDLVVVPCSAKGTVSKWTETHIQNFGLERPPCGGKEDLGRVFIKPFPGSGNITKFYAYAAAVYENASSFEALKAIGNRLGEFTQESIEIRLVELPLLGTGAGQMDADVSASALREGFLRSAHPDATMLIKAAQGVVDKIQRLFAETALAPATSPLALQSNQSFLGRIPPAITESLAKFKVEHPDAKRTAFIMMRFSQTRAHQQIFSTIEDTLNKHSMRGLRADTKEYCQTLFDNILTYMYGCGFGIAVLERLEQEEFNPNISLEIGYMMALGKPVLLLKDKTLKSLQSDLVGHLYRPFDPQSISETVPKEVSSWLKQWIPG
jgi:nucleoside 2-deoxyribosyltransferase